MSCYNLLIDQVSLPVVFINFLIYFIDIHIFWYWNHVFISFILQGSNKSFSNNKFSFVLPYKLNAFLLHFFLVLISLICWKIRCFYLPTFCLTVCYYYVTYEFQSESTHSMVCLNVKQLLARSTRHILRLSDRSVIRTNNHLVHKRTLNHLAKLAKWMNCVVSTYLYGTFECMLLSCHVRVSEWMYTL